MRPYDRACRTWKVCSRGSMCAQSPAMIALVPCVLPCLAPFLCLLSPDRHACDSHGCADLTSLPVRESRPLNKRAGLLASPYVALTRAKQFASITHASRRHSRGRWQQRSPSNFLQLLPSSSVASFAPNEARPYYHGASAFRASASYQPHCALRSEGRHPVRAP